MWGKIQIKGREFHLFLPFSLWNYIISSFLMNGKIFFNPVAVFISWSDIFFIFSIFSLVDIVCFSHRPVEEEAFGKRVKRPVEERGQQVSESEQHVEMQQLAKSCCFSTWKKSPFKSRDFFLSKSSSMLMKNAFLCVYFLIGLNIRIFNKMVF